MVEYTDTSSAGKTAGKCHKNTAAFWAFKLKPEFESFRYVKYSWGVFFWASSENGRVGRR